VASLAKYHLHFRMENDTMSKLTGTQDARTPAYTEVSSMPAADAAHGLKGYVYNADATHGLKGQNLIALLSLGDS